MHYKCQNLQTARQCYCTREEEDDSNNEMSIVSDCSLSVWSHVCCMTYSPSQPLNESQEDHVYSFSLGLAVLFIVYYGFNNTQGTNRDHLLHPHHCGTCNTLTEHSHWQEQEEDIRQVSLSDTLTPRMNNVVNQCPVFVVYPYPRK